jgi:hypothetical protein
VRGLNGHIFFFQQGRTESHDISYKSKFGKNIFVMRESRIFYTENTRTCCPRNCTTYISFFLVHTKTYVVGTISKSFVLHIWSRASVFLYMRSFQRQAAHESLHNWKHQTKDIILSLAERHTILYKEGAANRETSPLLSITKQHRCTFFFLKG